MRFDRLDLNLLVALDALLEHRNVSIAARRLNLSQPALSGALNRLRNYFKDDLLMPVGRQMILTAKAEELLVPVREVLMHIRARITTPRHFDPLSAKRQFTIIASDYLYTIILAPLIRRLASVAPGLTFDVLQTSRHGAEMLERGEADLMITLSGFLNADHPSRPLFSDSHKVIAWSDGRFGKNLSRDDFFEAGHVAVMFGGDKQPAFSETYFAAQGTNRRVDVRVPSFSAIPEAIVGTDRLATMYQRHAEFFARRLPVAIHDPPFAIPDITEEVQWLSLRDNDPGVQWLVTQIGEQAGQLESSF